MKTMAGFWDEVASARATFAVKAAPDGDILGAWIGLHVLEQVPSRGRSLGWAVSTGSDLGRRCARCCSVRCLSHCSPGTRFLALQCRQCPKVTGRLDSGETARLRAPGSPCWPQEVGTRVVQASGGTGEGGRSHPSASVRSLERNPISSHRSLLSRPASTRALVALGGPVPQEQPFLGPRGRGRLGRSVAGWNRAEDSDGGDTETVWAQRKPASGPADQATWGPGQDRLSGPHCITPLAQGRAPGQGAGGVGLQSHVGTWGRRTHGWPGSPLCHVRGLLWRG